MSEDLVTMSKMEIFENAEFGKIRTVIINEEPWFVGKDVAKALSYSNTKDALAKHIDPEDKTSGDGVVIRDPMGREQHPVIINESGLYSLIMSSKLPKAKEFKHWVTSEVLPSIRKHGMYATEATIDNLLNNPDFAIQTFTKLKEEMEARKKAEEELKYKSKVLEGMTDNIPLADKRRRISQIVRKGCTNAYQTSLRWSKLYKEFEMKYHLNLETRLKACKREGTKPCPKTKIDVVDISLNMIPELYEMCCKLFESDFNKIKAELETACVR